MLLFFQLLITVFSQAIGSLFFIALVLIVYLHIQMNAQQEVIWLGILRNSVANQLMNVVLYGMIAGMMASFIIVILGITVDYRLAFYMWPVALFLLLFDYRFLCFSYGAGIIALSSLLFNWSEIDVSSLAALAAVLHVAEGLLIYLDGHRDHLPVIVEHSRFKPVGGYVMRKLWPIPFVVLIVPGDWMQLGNGSIAMPGWWPLFRSPNAAAGLALFPVVAALTYYDITITYTPRERTRNAGFWAIMYGLVILIISLVSFRIYWMKYVAAVSMPLFHELLIILAKREYERGKPVFDAPWRGLRIFDVFPDSVAQEMGLMIGDIILSINGKQVNSGEMVKSILDECPSFIWMDVKREKEILDLEYRDYKNGIKDLGVLFVPRNTGKYYSIKGGKGIIFSLFDKIHRWQGR